MGPNSYIDPIIHITTLARLLSETSVHDASECNVWLKEVYRFLDSANLVPVPQDGSPYSLAIECLAIRFFTLICNVLEGMITEMEECGWVDRNGSNVDIDEVDFSIDVPVLGGTRGELGFNDIVSKYGEWFMPEENHERIGRRLVKIIKAFEKHAGWDSGHYRELFVFVYLGAGNLPHNVITAFWNDFPYKSLPGE